jgi:hypothetical protein
MARITRGFAKRESRVRAAWLPPGQLCASIDNASPRNKSGTPTWKRNSASDPARAAPSARCFRYGLTDLLYLGD